jgi:hypothetical protein
MLKLQRLFKNYQETGAFNEQVNLYGFVDSKVFLTKSGELGVILEVRGIDYECLDDASIDGLTKRLESALKLFDENYRIYQYLFKRNNEAIPYKLYGNPVVDTAIKNRIAYLAAKADTLFSLSVYYVILFEGSRPRRKIRSALEKFPEQPAKALGELWAYFSTRKQVVLLDCEISKAQATLLQKAESFILQVSDFLAARLLDKQEAFRILKKTLNFAPEKLDLAKLKYDTFLDYYLCESRLECHRGHLRLDDYYVKVLTLKEPSAQSFPLIFKRLLEVQANYYVVTEWKREDSGRTRRIIQAKRRHFHNTTEDLGKYLYEGHSVEMERDLRSLARQGLIQHKTFEGSDGRTRELLALTKAGYRLLRARHALPESQTAYYGFVKPKEASHDADIYRVYQKEGRRIARNGGRKFRVILDFELKKRLNRDFATFGAESRQEIAARHGLRVVNGKVPVPDLQIEYETAEGEMGRVDLELATEHYRPRQLAEKVRAGFSLYAPRSEADRLRRVLDQRELTAEILSL